MGMYPFFLTHHEIQYFMMAQFILQFMEQNNIFSLSIPVSGIHMNLN